jgi:hypothetical protein
VTFLADENFIEHAVRLLEAFDQENEVRHLTDHFKKGTADAEWIGAIGAWDPKPVVIGGDGRILRNKAELAALRTADLSFVFLASGWTKLDWNTFAWKIVKAWPGIVENVQRAREPTVFEVRPGNLKVRRIGETRRL